MYKTSFAEPNENGQSWKLLLWRLLQVVVTASSPTLVTLFSELGTATSVVDEPVADLRSKLVINH